jgi:hypothetical protein
MIINIPAHSTRSAIHLLSLVVFGTVVVLSR